MKLDSKNEDGPRKRARHAAALRNPSRDPLPSTKLKVRIIRLVMGGCTLTEVCERKDMPAWSTLFEWRDADPDFDAAVEKALLGLATYIVHEGADLAREEAVKDQLDTDRNKVLQGYADVANKFAAAIAPRRFGALAKLGVDGECTPQLQIVTFASAPIVGAEQSDHARTGPLIDGRQKPSIQATAVGKAQSTRSTGNGRAGRGDSSGKQGRKVQANPTQRSNARRTKGRP